MEAGMEQEEKRKTQAKKAAFPEETPKAGLFELFLTFVRIGAATFGGGVAMLPVIEHEVTEKKHWASEDELTDYYAISQCTPGAIAVNTATFVGSKMRGAIGGIVATLGVIFPSMVIICVIAAFLKNFANIPAVGHAFAGIRACVTVLIFQSVLKIGKGDLVDLFSWILFLIVMALSIFTSISTPLLVILAGVTGYVMMLLRRKRDRKGAR